MFGNPLDLLVDLSKDVRDEPENAHRPAHELLDISLTRTTILLTQAQRTGFEGWNMKRVEQLAIIAEAATDKKDGRLNLVREYLVAQIGGSK